MVGEVDLATAPRYRSEIVAASAATEALAVDLSDCDLIDSVGLGVTLGAARRLWQAGGRFAVVASPSVRRTFERCRLDEILDIVATADELTLTPERPRP